MLTFIMFYKVVCLIKLLGKLILLSHFPIGSKMKIFPLGNALNHLCYSNFSKIRNFVC